MSKSIFLIGFLTVFSIGVYGQKAHITVEQDPKIEQLLDIYKESKKKSSYYTVQVGFGNSSTAERLKSEVEVDFPTWPSQIIFDTPTYRVQLGRFKERLVAERRYREVREKYPAAILLKIEPDKKR